MIDQRYLTLHDEMKIPVWEIFILIFIYEEQFEFLQRIYDENFIEFRRIIRFLENYGLVKWHGDLVRDITLRKKGEDLFKKHVGTKKKIITAKEVGTWIDSWRELFPEGINPSGFRYRGNRQECVKKMVKFVSEYDYTTEQIFTATRNYVDKFAEKGFAYMQQAHYFIDKRNVGSTLSSFCEELTNEKSNNKETTYGRSVK